MGGHDVYSMSKGATELSGAELAEELLPARSGSAITAWRSPRRAPATPSAAVTGPRTWIVPSTPCAPSRPASRVPVRNPEPGPPLPGNDVLEPLSGIPAPRREGSSAARRPAAWRGLELRSCAGGARGPVPDVVRAMAECRGSGSWGRRTGRPRRPSMRRRSCLRLCVEKAFRPARLVAAVAARWWSGRSIGIWPARMGARGALQHLTQRADRVSPGRPW